MKNNNRMTPRQKQIRNRKLLLHTITYTITIFLIIYIGKSYVKAMSNQREQLENSYTRFSIYAEQHNLELNQTNYVEYMENN